MPNKIRIVGAPARDFVTENVRFPYVRGVEDAKAVRIYDTGTANETYFTAELVNVVVTEHFELKTFAASQLASPDGYHVDVVIERNAGTNLRIGTYTFLPFQREVPQPKVDSSRLPTFNLRDDGNGGLTATAKIPVRSPFAAVGAELPGLGAYSTDKCIEFDTKARQVDAANIEVKLTCVLRGGEIRPLAMVPLTMTILSDGYEMERVEGIDSSFP